jgi:hypothetical protein
MPIDDESDDVLRWSSRKVSEERKAGRLTQAQQEILTRAVEDFGARMQAAEAQRNARDWGQAGFVGLPSDVARRRELTGGKVRPDKTTKCKPSEEIAYRGYEAACKTAGCELTDKEAHEYVTQHAHGDGVKIPALATWSRQLRAGRKAHERTG